MRTGLQSECSFTIDGTLDRQDYLPSSVCRFRRLGTATPYTITHPRQPGDHIKANESFAMLGITDVSTYVPPGFESNFEKKKLFGIDDAFIENKIGVHRVSRMAQGQEASDMCVEAYRDLVSRRPDMMKPDCVIVCTQHPDGRGVPHTSSILHSKLNLPEDCACFDIALACSGYVYSLSIATSFMQANGMERGLLFTSDPYSHDLSPKDKNTILLFGDAATCTALSDVTRSGWGLVPRRFRFQTNGEMGYALHNRNGHLFMDGRAVFNFAVRAVPGQVRELLSSSGLGVDDVDLYLFHQGSRLIVTRLQESLGVSSRKVPVKMADFGNTISSTIPLLLEDYIGRNGFRQVVMSGFGVGLSWASALLTVHGG